MPKFEVRKSIEIDTPLARVSDIILDFKQWPAWSPWLCAEPDCPVTFHGSAGEIGHGQDWNGKVIGTGGIRLRSATAEHIEMDLNFLKPFKSKADIAFTLRPINDNRCSVEWAMNSSLPFFMFFLTPTFTAMIGADYRRGLLQLKDYAQTGSAGTKSEVMGVVDTPASHYISTSGSSAIENIGDVMGEKFQLLYQNLPENSVDQGATSYALYDKFNIRQQSCDFSAAVAIDKLELEKNFESSLSGKGIKTGSIAACKALKVVHTGDYHHLGNAWATAMMHMRAKKLKPLKSQPPFEKYLDNPETTPGPQRVTEIYLPVR